MHPVLTNHTPDSVKMLTGRVVADWVVPAMVAKLQLEGLATKCLTQNLVPHADAKHRLLAQDGACVVHRVRRCAWVTLVNGAYMYDRHG